MTLSKTQLNLLPKAPFEFDRSLEFLGRFTPTKSHYTIQPHILTQAFDISGRAVVCQIESRGKVESPRLRINCWSETPLDSSEKSTLTDRITFYLSAKENIQPFYNLAASDEAMTSLINRWYGYHQVKFVTPFASACWAILSTRISQAQASKMLQGFVEALGAKLLFDDNEYVAFPDPAGITTPDQLTPLIKNQRKANYLFSATRAFASIDEQWLRTAPYQEVDLWLQDIKGVGPWSANLILVRGLGRMNNRIAPNQKRFLNGIRHYYGAEITAQQAQAIQTQYGEWQGYWAHYLKLGA